MSFSLVKIGNLQHYLITFQKELLKAISKSTTIALKEEYDLKTDGNSGARAKEFGHDLTPEPIPNQLVFSIKFHVLEDTMQCGLLCFHSLIGTTLTPQKDKLGVKCSLP